MDEMTSVRSLRDDVPAPDRARLDPGRHLLLNAAAGGPTRRRSPRVAWRLSVIGATAAVVATVVVATQLGASGGPAPQRPPLGDATALLALAADTVERNDVTEPRPRQWIYERSLLRLGDCSHQQHEDTELLYPSVDGMVDPCDQPHNTIEQEDWIRFDGEKGAGWGYLENEENPPFRVHDMDLDGDERTPQEFYELMSSLPTEDPEALLATLRERSVIHPGGASQAERDFTEMRILFETAYVFPPEVQAALYRALATVPGVEVADHLVEDLAGRSAVAVTFVTDSFNGRVRHELLLDPETYAYLGERSVAAEDFVEPVTDVERREGDLITSTAVLETVVTDEAEPMR
ncbi:CU044_5270 family protein [Streptomyces sp. 4N509B]|uniref:CU044_5270 family protein n=1 Tax=Streptomyces sp. 4N509B TaxID=3457413 RepID=UPI003FD65335